MLTALVAAPKRPTSAATSRPQSRRRATTATARPQSAAALRQQQRALEAQQAPAPSPIVQRAVAAPPADDGDKQRQRKAARAAAVETLTSETTQPAASKPARLTAVADAAPTVSAYTRAERSPTMDRGTVTDEPQIRPQRLFKDSSAEPMPMPSMSSVSRSTASTGVATDPARPSPVRSTSMITETTSRADAATSAAPSGRSSRSLSPQEGYMWRGTFLTRNAAGATMADLRLEALERFLASDVGSHSGRCDDVEITLRDVATRRPFLVSRDVRRAGEESRTGEVEVEAFVYAAPGTITNMPAVSPAPVERKPAPTPPLPLPASDESSTQPPSPNMDGARKKSSFAPSSDDSPPPSARNRPMMSTRGGPSSPPERVNAPGRAGVTIPVTYNGEVRSLKLPISKHPPLEAVLRYAVELFESDSRAVEMFLPMASLSYVRHAGATGRKALITITDDHHIPGLVWEALEQERTGGSTKALELSLAVRRTAPA
jgi:hypothetical protein